MNRLVWIALLASLSLPAFGQATRDRNLAATRKHSATSTVLPPTMNNQKGAKDTNSQLDKLERQTANTVIQPAAKSPKVQPYKLPPEPKPAADNFYPQSMSGRSGAKNIPGNSNRTAQRPAVKPYKR